VSAPVDREPEHLVELVVPADVRFVAPVRLVAASLASDLGFSIDDLDELRIAIDEALTAVLARRRTSPTGTTGTVRVTFTLDAGGSGTPGRLHVEGALDPPTNVDGDGAVPVDPLVLHIIAAVTDGYELETGRFALVKRSSYPRD